MELAVEIVTVAHPGAKKWRLLWIFHEEKGCFFHFCIPVMSGDVDYGPIGLGVLESVCSWNFDAKTIRCWDIIVLIVYFVI